LYAGQSRELFVVDRLERGQVAGDDVEEMVGVPEESLSVTPGADWA
jgi:hypothetical protein